MPILGDRTKLAAFTGRKTSNAITLRGQDATGAEVFVAAQKGSAGVLFGFKNGGASTYNLTSATGDLTVHAGTPCTVDGVGLIDHTSSGGTVKAKDGTVLATIGGHAGSRTDDIWTHPLADASGTPLGTITWLRTHPGRTPGRIVSEIYWQIELPNLAQPLKVPSYGAALELAHPVDAVLGDLLVGALVDVACVPRGYLLGA